ncbi:Ig-like domain-containing protein [Agrobacterium sp.]|uniref:Ig-like domain-containing protein n=1 Tax=Agrobacterium sp. TaxID=361 RepID=UPI0028ADC6AE|nr:Ig-like domain-containing protein [Agrobacterium sp.]
MAKPTAVADFDTIYLNDPDGSIFGNITANDTSDGGAIYLRSLNGTTVGAKKGLEQVTYIEGKYGIFEVSPNGNYKYTLNPDMKDKEVPVGGWVERVGYKISDGGGNTDYDYLTITIKGEHIKPVAVDKEVTVTGNLITGDLTADDNIFVGRIGGENLATANPNDFSLKFVQPDGSTVISGLYGDLHIDRDGTYTYEVYKGHNFSETVSERFQFRIYDDAFGEFADNSQTTDVGVLKISIPAHTDLV